MGHDIMGYNNKDEEVAYARYGMSNRDATLLYRIFDSIELHAGVSGCGEEKEFTFEQVEKAKVVFEKLKDEDFENVEYEKEKLNNFINNCYSVAKTEGIIRIFFG